MTGLAPDLPPTFIGSVVLADYAALQARLGSEVAVSDYVLVDQERIEQFARITDDAQWIHTDVERAQRESPFGQTIAHGFLSLSLLARFLEDTVRLSTARLVLSCGLNAVRFMSPIVSGSNVRARVRLRACSRGDGFIEATWRFTLECEGQRLPAAVADWTVRYLE